MKLSKGKGADQLFGVLVCSVLFLYAGFILAVIWADVTWLAVPRGGEPAGISKVVHSQDAFDQVRFAFRLSMVSSFITSLLAMAVAIPSAYALSRRRVPLKGLIDLAIDLPIVIPPLLAGISLLIFLSSTGLGKWLNLRLDIVYTTRAIVVAQFYVASAFCVRATKAAIDQVNPRFEAVARSLGCGPFRAFRQVTLPLAKSGLIAGWIMTWARSMGEFAPIMVLAGASPGRTTPLPVTAFLELSAGNMEVSVAVTLLMIAIAAVTLVIFKRLGGKGYLW